MKMFSTTALALVMLAAPVLAQTPPAPQPWTGSPQSEADRLAAARRAEDVRRATDSQRIDEQRRIEDRNRMTDNQRIDDSRRSEDNGRDAEARLVQEQRAQNLRDQAMRDQRDRNRSEQDRNDQNQRDQNQRDQFRRDNWQAGHDRGWRDGRDVRTASIRCESYNYHYRRCDFAAPGRASLQGRIAGNCRPGYGWGQRNDHSLWVNHGCRADFLIR